MGFCRICFSADANSDVSVGGWKAASSKASVKVKSEPISPSKSNPLIVIHDCHCIVGKHLLCLWRRRRCQGHTWKLRLYYDSWSSKCVRFKKDVFLLFILYFLELEPLHQHHSVGTKLDSWLRWQQMLLEQQLFAVCFFYLLTQILFVWLFVISARSIPFRFEFFSDAYEMSAAAGEAVGGTSTQHGFQVTYFQTAC